MKRIVAVGLIIVAPSVASAQGTAPTAPDATPTPAATSAPAAAPAPAATPTPAATSPAPAAAPTPTAAPAPADPSFEVLAAQLASGVQNKEPVDSKSTFATGERGWVWLKIQPKREGAMLRLRWTLNDAPVWTMGAVPARLGRVWYYKTFDQPGEWKVEVLDESENVLHTASVSVSGDPIAPRSPTRSEEPVEAQVAAAPAAAAAEAAKPVPAAPAGDHFEVLDLRLALEVKDREPTAPASVFPVGAKVYAWAKLDVREPETSLRFRWYADDALVYTSDPVAIRQSPTWRTWGSKTADRAGSWKVEIIDAEDRSLQSLAFTVQ